MSRRVSSALFRGILSWCRAHRDVPFVSRVPSLTSWVAEVDSPAAGATEVDYSKTAISALKEAFREGGTPEDVERMQDTGFEFLRFLNSDLSEELSQARKRRAEHIDRTGVSLTVGSVVRHRKYRFTGVVAGWDRGCRRSPEWVSQNSIAALPNGTAQPFYTVLPDERDCRALWGGPRAIKYVAQDNLERVTSSSLCDEPAGTRGSAEQNGAEAEVEARQALPSGRLGASGSGGRLLRQKNYRRVLRPLKARAPSTGAMAIAAGGETADDACDGSISLSADAKIMHADLGRHFRAWDRRRKGYVPTQLLRWEYPNDYPDIYPPAQGDEEFFDSLGAQGHFELRQKSGGLGRPAAAAAPSLVVVAAESPALPPALPPPGVG